MDWHEGCKGLGPRGSKTQTQIAEAWAFIRSEGVGRKMDRCVDGQESVGVGHVKGFHWLKPWGQLGVLTGGSLSHASLSDGTLVRPSPPQG